MRPLLYRLILIIYLFLPLSVFADELRIASPHWEGYKREFEWRFIEWYRQETGRDISIRWLDLGGASDTLRYILSQSKSVQSRDLGIDLLFGGGVDPFVELKRQNLLEPVTEIEGLLKNIPASLGGNPIYDPQRHWFSVNLAGFGIIFNKKLLTRYDFPTPSQWSDLANPRFRGWIGSADPRKSGSIRFVYELILQFYGWEKGWQIIYGIAANIRTFNSHSSQTPKDIALGEVAAGLLIDSYAREAIREVGEENVGFVIPGEFPAVYGDGIALLRGSQNREVAIRYIEFALSPEAQRLLMKRTGTQGGPKRYELGKMSVRPEIYNESPEDMLLISPPWSANVTFRYDPDQAAKRWSVTTALLGILVDIKDDLAASGTFSPRFYEKLPPPMTEEQLDSLSTSTTWKDPKSRAKIIAHTQQQLLRTLPKRADQGDLRYVPVLTVLLLISYVAVRRIFGAFWT